MGEVIGSIDLATMQAITWQLAVVLGMASRVDRSRRA
jgi:hypothetical protein